MAGEDDSEGEGSGTKRKREEGEEGGKLAYRPVLNSCLSLAPDPSTLLLLTLHALKTAQACHIWGHNNKCESRQVRAVAPL